MDKTLLLANIEKHLDEMADRADDRGCPDLARRIEKNRKELIRILSK